MTIETFEDQLNRWVAADPETGYRVRWSNLRRAWQVEQKMGRGVFDAPELHPEARIRVTDGFQLVAEIVPEPRIKCDTCYQWVDIPFGKWSEARCAYCYAHGEKSMYFVGYFPFSDALVQHFQKTGPRRTLARKVEREAADKAEFRTYQRDRGNRLEAILRERHSSIVGIPSWGYTGAYQAVA